AIALEGRGRARPTTDTRRTRQTAATNGGDKRRARRCLAPTTAGEAAPRPDMALQPRAFPFGYDSTVPNFHDVERVTTHAVGHAGEPLVHDDEPTLDRALDDDKAHVWVGGLHLLESFTHLGAAHMPHRVLPPDMKEHRLAIRWHRRCRICSGERIVGQFCRGIRSLTFQGWRAGKIFRLELGDHATVSYLADVDDLHRLAVGHSRHALRGDHEWTDVKFVRDPEMAAWVAREKRAELIA